MDFCLNCSIKMNVHFFLETAIHPKGCKWNETCHQFETLPEAQVMRERLHGECYGVSSIQKREAGVGTVTLYVFWDYKSKENAFKLKDFLVDYVGAEFNDEASSLSCQPTPCTVIAFQHSQFTGFQISYETKAKYVGKDYNDRFSSFIFVPYSLSVLCIEIFSEPSFNGVFKKVCGDTIFSSVVMVRSLKLSWETCSVIMYRNVYKGSFKEFSADVSEISEEWIEVKSVKFRNWVYEEYQGKVQSPVTFYEDKYFKGQSEEAKGKVGFVSDAMNDKYSFLSCLGKCNVLVNEHKKIDGTVVLYHRKGSQMFLDRVNYKMSSAVLILYDDVDTGMVTVWRKLAPSTRTLNVLRRKWIDAYKKLSPNLKNKITEREYLALRAYTAAGRANGGISTNMNNYLRDTPAGRKLPKGEIDIFKENMIQLDSFLAKQTKYVKSLIRYEKVLPGLNDYRLNTEIFNPTYLSTSKRTDIKVTDIIGTVRKGNDYYKLTIQPKYAVDVHQFLPSGEGNYDLLEEVLFPRNTKFKVIRMDQPKSVTYTIDNEKYTVKEINLFAEEVID